MGLFRPVAGQLYFTFIWDSPTAYDAVDLDGSFTRSDKSKLFQTKTCFYATDTIWRPTHTHSIAVGRHFPYRPDRLWGPPSLLCTWHCASLPEVKRPGLVAGHPPPCSTEVKEAVELYIYSRMCAFIACSKVNFIIHQWRRGRRGKPV
jgi:hypothetical protein